MQSLRKPVLSARQRGPDEGPKAYAPWDSMPLVSLFGKFIFRHYDLCLFHQGIDGEVRERKVELEKFVGEYPSLPPDEQYDEAQAIFRSRIGESIFEHETITRSIQAFGDQLLVIALWAMVEQYVGRALIETERGLDRQQGASSPHQWHSLVRRFNTIGVDLTSARSYAGANECRIVNNKIKHVGAVDRELASLQRFSGHLNQDLDLVQMDLQYYSDSVHEFVCWTMQAADCVLSGRPIGP